ATVCASYAVEMMNKVRKALSIGGPTFIHSLDPCPKGWDYDPMLSHELGELAVETGIFPLYEVQDGVVRHYGKTKAIVEGRPRKPVREYLLKQGRFAHFTEEDLGYFQAKVDEMWNKWEIPGVIPFWKEKAGKWRRIARGSGRPSRSAAGLTPASPAGHVSSHRAPAFLIASARAGASARGADVARPTSSAAHGDDVRSRILGTSRRDRLPQPVAVGRQRRGDRPRRARAPRTGAHAGAGGWPDRRGAASARVRRRRPRAVANSPAAPGGGLPARVDRLQAGAPCRAGGRHDPSRVLLLGGDVDHHRRRRHDEPRQR